MATNGKTTVTLFSVFIPAVIAAFLFAGNRINENKNEFISVRKEIIVGDEENSEEVKALDCKLDSIKEQISGIKLQQTEQKKDLEYIIKKLDKIGD